MRTRAGAGLAWALAVAAVAVLASERLRGAFASVPLTDFRLYLEAGRRVAAGESPYDVTGYVYSPLLALLISPWSDHPRAYEIWSAVEVLAGLAAVVTATLVLARRRVWPGWRGPALFLGAGISLFASWGVTMELFMGQVQLVLLLLLVIAWALGRGSRSGAAGAVLAAATALKTWPLPFLVGLWRPGERRATRRLLGGFVVAGIVFASWITVGVGPQEWVRWVQTTADYSSQPLAIYGAWGVGRHLFTANPNVLPLSDLPWLASLTTALAVAVAVALLAWTLRVSADRDLRYWHVVALVILLLPVVHFLYWLLVLPLVWLRAWRVLAGPSGPGDWVSLGLFAAWWVVTLRLPVGESFLHAPTSSYLGIMALTYAALGWSVALDCRQAHPVTSQQSTAVPTGREGPASA